MRLFLQIFARAINTFLVGFFPLVPIRPTDRKRCSIFMAILDICAWVTPFSVSAQSVLEQRGVGSGFWVWVTRFNHVPLFESAWRTFLSLLSTPSAPMSAGHIISVPQSGGCPLSRWPQGFTPVHGVHLRRGLGPSCSPETWSGAKPKCY